MISFFSRRYKRPLPDLHASDLFDQNTFYKAFEKDLLKCTSELVIESPFITTNRVDSLLLTFKKVRSRGIRIVVNTRHPSEHSTPYDSQAWQAIVVLQNLGIEVLFTGRLHRKIAIIDQKIVWNGSLNILSQNDSCEIMQRITSKRHAFQLINFTGLTKFL